MYGVSSRGRKTAKSPFSYFCPPNLNRNTPQIPFSIFFLFFYLFFFFFAPFLPGHFCLFVMQVQAAADALPRSTSTSDLSNALPPTPQTPTSSWFTKIAAAFKPATVRGAITSLRLYHGYSLDRFVFCVHVVICFHLAVSPCTSSSRRRRRPH